MQCAIYFTVYLKVLDFRFIKTLLNQTDFGFIIKKMLNDLTQNRRNRFVILIIIAAIFLTFAAGSALTNRPQIDEGMFASPALNLAREGFFGTTVLETGHTKLTRIEQRTYWVMPLFLLNASASFKAFGFSLFTMRLVSIFWGLIFVLAGYLIALKLSENKNIALLGALFLACDYMVLDTASQARPDMMCAALGFSAIAAFLVWRERNFSIAVLLSQTLVVLAGLTHPNGILAFFAVAFLTLFFDFKQIKLKHLGFAIIPYLIGGAGFGFYILQDPQAFKDQFIDNARMSGRMGGFGSPFSAILREFTERYPHAFGLQANSGGHSGPIFLKSLILVGYALGFLGVLLTKELRNNKNYRALLILTVIYFRLDGVDGRAKTDLLHHPTRPVLFDNACRLDKFSVAEKFSAAPVNRARSKRTSAFGNRRNGSANQAEYLRQFLQTDDRVSQRKLDGKRSDNGRRGTRFRSRLSEKSHRRRAVRFSNGKTSEIHYV